MKFPTLLCGAFITGNWLNEKKVNQEGSNTKLLQLCGRMSMNLIFGLLGMTAVILSNEI